jgi:hypothetical protein
MVNNLWLLVVVVISLFHQFENFSKWDTELPMKVSDIQTVTFFGWMCKS